MISIGKRSFKVLTGYKPELQKQLKKENGN